MSEEKFNMPFFGVKSKRCSEPGDISRATVDYDYLKNKSAQLVEDMRHLDAVYRELLNEASTYYDLVCEYSIEQFSPYEGLKEHGLTRDAIEKMASDLSLRQIYEAMMFIRFNATNQIEWEFSTFGQFLIGLLEAPTSTEYIEGVSQ